MKQGANVTIYGDMTRYVLRSGTEAREAWRVAGLAIEASASVRSKSCPKSAFVSLAENGYISGFPALWPLPGVSKNAEYVLCGARLLASHPELRQSKAQLWASIMEEEAIERRDQNGVLDVLYALLDEKALLTLDRLARPE